MCPVTCWVGVSSPVLYECTDQWCSYSPMTCSVLPQFCTTSLLHVLPLSLVLKASPVLQLSSLPPPAKKGRKVNGYNVFFSNYVRTNPALTSGRCCEVWRVCVCMRRCLCQSKCHLSRFEGTQHCCSSEVGGAVR